MIDAAVSRRRTPKRHTTVEHSRAMDPEDLEIAREVAQNRRERDEDERQIQSIPLGQLVRHPKNRKIDSSDPEIKQLAASIAEHTQLEPLRVRQIANNKYQIISGERRFTALTLANIYAARCLVVDISDATALKEVAAANSHRKDLNPIERAELMQLLMESPEKGGSGMTLVDAGRVFGLNSESGCKNALRLLKLPQPIREQLIDGRLPERYARALIPYVGIEPIMKQVIKDLESVGYDRAELMSAFEDDDLASWMQGLIDRDARPVSEDLTRWHQYPIGGNLPCLFEWQSHESKLQIFEIPTNLGYDSKTKRNQVELRKWAFNTKLWDKLQEPLAKKAAEEGKKKSSSSNGATKAKPEKKLTPAEQKAADKKRAAEAEQRLDTFTRDWIGRIIRSALASRLHDDALVALTLPWIVGQCNAHELRDAHEHALIECRIRPGKTHNRTLDAMPAAAKGEQTRFAVLSAFWRILLWPVSHLIGDDATRSKLTAAGNLPDRLVSLGYGPDNVLALAAHGGVSMETAWKAGATDGSDERSLIAVWLCRHTKAQLHKLRLELNVTEGSETMSRDELAGCVLNAHRPGKPLPLPKRLARA